MQQACCQWHIKDASERIHLEPFKKLWQHFFIVPLQDKLDFRDPIMVMLEFGLADEDKGPVLDGELPTSINKTVRCLSHFPAV